MVKMGDSAASAEQDSFLAEVMADEGNAEEDDDLKAALSARKKKSKQYVLSPRLPRRSATALANSRLERRGQGRQGVASLTSPRARFPPHPGAWPTLRCLEPAHRPARPC